MAPKGRCPGLCLHDQCQMGMLQDIQSRGKGDSVSVPTKCLSVSKRSEDEQLRKHQRQDRGFGKRWKCGSVVVGERTEY